MLRWFDWNVKPPLWPLWKEIFIGSQERNYLPLSSSSLRKECKSVLSVLFCCTDLMVFSHNLRFYTEIEFTCKERAFVHFRNLLKAAYVCSSLCVLLFSDS